MLIRRHRREVQGRSYSWYQVQVCQTATVCVSVTAQAVMEGRLVPSELRSWDTTSGGSPHPATHPATDMKKQNQLERHWYKFKKKFPCFLEKLFNNIVFSTWIIQLPADTVYIIKISNWRLKSNLLGWKNQTSNNFLKTPTKSKIKPKTLRNMLTVPWRRKSQTCQDSKNWIKSQHRKEFSKTYS